MSVAGRPAWLRRRRRENRQRNVVEQLAVALAAADRDGIRAALHPHVRLVVDSGGRVRTEQESAEGGDVVTRTLLGLVPSETSVRTTSINGMPGFVLARNRRVVCAVTAEVTAGLVSSVWLVCNPDKLRHWDR